MPVTKTATRELRVNKRRKEINKTRISRARTFVKKVEAAIAKGDKKAAQEAFKPAQAEILRSVTKGLIAKNTAARKLSRLSARIKKIAAK